jgi:hypothetical protein
VRVTVVQVLVDADNLTSARLRLLVEALGIFDPTDVRMVVAGAQTAVEDVGWPAYAQVLHATGWQRADVVLVEAYEAAADRVTPLVLASGDGDFALLASRHGGPVLVVSGSPSSRLRDNATVVDPAMAGVEPLVRWLRAVTVDQSGAGK